MINIWQKAISYCRVSDQTNISASVALSRGLKLFLEVFLQHNINLKNKRYFLRNFYLMIRSERLSNKLTC